MQGNDEACEPARSHDDGAGDQSAAGSYRTAIGLMNTLIAAYSTQIANEGDPAAKARLLAQRDHHEAAKRDLRVTDQERARKVVQEYPAMIESMRRGGADE